MTPPNPSPVTPAQPQLNPGDEAPSGLPGTGEDICPSCGGNGTLKGAECPECAGTGHITRAVGGG